MRTRTHPLTVPFTAKASATSGHSRGRFALPLVTAALTAAFCLCSVARAGSLQESYNTGFTADPWHYYATYDAGWMYTPGTSYDLSGIETEFSIPVGITVENRTITVSVYQNDTPANGGTLLGSFNFDSSVAEGSLGGGSFSTPISLAGGTQYFIAFDNVGQLSNGDLGVQWVTNNSGSSSSFAANPSATTLSPWYFDGNTPSCPTDGEYACSVSTDAPLTNQPILAFYGTSPVSPPPPPPSSAPEPTSLALLLAGLGLLVLARRRSRPRV